MVELMKTLIMEEKYSKEINIDTLFWLGYVLWQDELLSNISKEYGEIWRTKIAREHTKIV
jgi:hypothetical protein